MENLKNVAPIEDFNWLQENLLNIFQKILV